ncbi:MAG: DUF1573 domain-containing protein [Puniceicoccales bacterium]|jgi:hypothetical protein|nr:DUF1573 domain-containing protein [Puniceicoccales bacterium]
MQKRLFPLFLFTAAVAAGALAAPTVVLGAGVVFDAVLISVPCKAGQTEVRAEIPFRVVGGETLRVTSIKTGCDCTSGEADAASYAPGTRGKIKIVFTVGERIGLQRKTITIKTSDGREQAVFFQTTVPVIMQLTPAFVLWRKGSAAEAKVVRAKVMLREKTVRVLGAKVTPAGAFAVEIQPQANASGKHPEQPHEYAIKITPRSTAVPVTARIVLETDFPADKTERFVVVAAVK